MSKPTTRGRMILREISDSKKFASLSPEAAVLFCLIIPHLSSYGKLHGGAGYVKDIVCPHIPYIPMERIPYLLSEISEKTSVKYFEFEGRPYLHSIHHEEHQKLDPNKLGTDLLPNHSEGILISVGSKSVTKYKYKNKDKNKDKIKVKTTLSDSEISPDLLPTEMSTPTSPPLLSGKPDGVKPNGRIPYEQILLSTNSILGKHYRNTTEFRKTVKARWEDGFRVEDFEQVCTTMRGKWGHDPKMQQYLRPITLFSTKMDSYLNQTITLSDRGIVSPKLEAKLHVFDDFCEEIRREREQQNKQPTEIKEIEDVK